MSKARELTPIQRVIRGKYTEAKECAIGGQNELGYTVSLKSGVQSFNLSGYVENKENAEWYRDMLAVAISSIVEEMK